MKKFGRAMALILTAALTAQMLPVTAYAADDVTCSGGNHTIVATGTEAHALRACTTTTAHFITGNPNAATTLTGGSGGDYIFLGAGNTATGNGGKDAFVFSTASLTGTTAYTITDFNPNEDVIVLQGQSAAPTLTPAEYNNPVTISFKQGEHDVSIRLANCAAGTDVISQSIILSGDAAGPWVKSMTPTGTVTVVKGQAGPELKVSATLYTGIGTDAVSYQWQKDNKDIPDAKAASYTPATTDAGSAAYKCVVTANGKSVSSAAVTVSVTEPTCAVVAGKDNIELTCSVGSINADAYDNSAACSASLKGLTGQCGIADHNKNSHDYSVDLSVSPADKGLSIQDGKLVLDKSKLGSAASVEFTVTASVVKGKNREAIDPSAVKTATVIVTQTTEACTKAITALSKPDGLAAVAMNDSTANASQDYKTTPTWSGGCTTTGHTDEALHGKAITWQLVDDKGAVVSAPAGVTLTPKAGSPAVVTLTVEKDKLAAASTTIRLQAVSGDVKSEAFPITITRPATCAKTVKELSSKSGGNAIVANGQSGTATYEYVVTGALEGSCLAGHTDGDNPLKGHGIPVTWAVTQENGSALAADSGISVAPKKDDSTVGVLTVDKSKLSPTPVKVKITASSGGKTFSWTVEVSREKTCSWTILPTKLEATPALSGNTITVSNTATITQQFKVTYNQANEKQCEFGDADHPGKAGHTLKWEIVETSAAQWASIDQSGKLTIDGKKLPSDSNALTVKVSTKEGAQTYTLTVKRSSKTCTLKYTDLGKVKTSTGLTGSGRVNISSSTTTITLDTTKKTTSGSCQFGSASHYPQQGNHTIKWEIVGGAPDGVKLDGSKLIVTKSKLDSSEVKVTVKASAGSLSVTAELTLVKKSSSSSGSDRKNREYEEWQDLSDKIDNADSKDIISVKMGSNTDMPASILEDLKGRNVTLKVSVSGGYTWTVNGKSVGKIPDYQIYIPLAVEEITSSKISKLAKERDIVILDLQHEGSFYADMKLTVPLSSTYANKTVYLYKYNESSGKLVYKSSVKADDNGRATFPFTSASTYVVTSKALSSSDGASSASPASSTSTYVPPASVVTSSSSSSASSQSSSSSESSSLPESSESSESSEPSEPTVAEPDDEDDKPEKKGIPIIVPILIVVIALVIIAVVILSRGGGFGKRYDD